ncbi:sensor histidine kinase [Myxosarcina sp. GI1(2024)]
MELERVLVAKTDRIIEKWLERVRQDLTIESTAGLNRQKLQDSIPSIVEMIAKNITYPAIEPAELSTQKADVHGVLCAQQNFHPEEIAREFFLLRQIIIAEIKDELIDYSPLEVVDTIASIDATLDYLVAQSFKTYTQQKLNQLEQLQHQLLLTNQELTRLVEVHKNGFSYLTHEIKNPLTSILGYSELLLRQTQQNSDNNSTVNLRHIKQVLTQGRKILRLVNDSLEFASYQAGTIELKWETVDVGSLLDDIVLTLEPLATAKDLQLIVTCNPKTLKFTTDSLRLQQILINLVTNGIRYTESGKIEVTCQTTEEGGLRIIVADTGIGIPQEYHSRIFEPYFQVKPKDSYPSESRGLGLAIVGQLVKMLKGKIWVDSEVAAGSTFTVVLPKLEPGNR